MAQTKNEVAKATKTAVAKADALADINDGLLEAAQAEQDVRAESGSSMVWIAGPISGDSEYATKGSKSYIKGAVKNSYVIGNKKINLGEEFKAVVLGMFKVFAEQTATQGKDEMAKTVSYWLPEQAMQIPLEGQFSRPLGNGNELVPCHWLFLYLPDHPEITEPIVLSFRSTGNKYFSKIEKAVKGNSKISPELMVTIGSTGVLNEKYGKTYFYPTAEIEETRNFAFDETGVHLTKDGLDEDTVRDIIGRYKELQLAFKNGQVVARKANIEAYLPGATGGDSDYTEDGDDVKF